MSDQISLLIAGVCQVKPRNSAVNISWDRATEHDCRQFFSASNIYLFLELYWAIWSPNVPLLHRPTFEISIAKPVLIAAMVTIGASVSSSKADRLAAIQFSNCVEEAVFCDDQFCTEEDCRLFPSKAKIQSLQAAYIVMLYQNWEGSTSSKSRIRRFRYSKVVAVARDVGIGHARHEIYTSAIFDWQDFILREELIRVILWIFLLDTAFVIFNNVPPRMAIKEMKMSFARNDACFQAPNSETCLQQVMISQQEPRFLSSACEMICNRTITDGELASFGHLGSLNLFVATSAIHSMIFQVQQSFSPQLQLGPIYNALANWHLLWQRHIKVDPLMRSHDAALSALHITKLWQREGFSRFAPEYWMLASMLAQRLDRTDQDVVDKSREEPEVKTEAKDELLENYDTDMRQVNSLIAEFQKVML
ncbi:hypothetical protein CBER1_08422 [Cercospora berteroae]|uniref:Xylanolytic transcriptional activator regulatory domain-containing protein n=1 Tax=Cercospora berteroae TaxID=357750 RepID=A0A2S6C514_9PEZI|nr:hypothetical protein CBER1_08422 [Cercospora berteroae]